MIIAVRDNDKIVFASCQNRAWGNGVDYESMFREDNFNVWRTVNPKNAIVAFNGLPLGADILRYDADVFDGEPTFEHVVKDIVPRVCDKFSRYYLLDESGKGGAEIVLAQGNKMFLIDSDWACNEVGEFCILGNRFESDVAHASLERTRGLPTIERLKQAFSDLNIIRREQNFVLTIDTETLKFKRLNLNK